MGKEMVNQVQEAQSLRQDKSKQEHIKTRSNQTNEKQRQKLNTKSNKEKTTNNLQRNFHTVISWFLNRNYTEGNGMIYSKWWKGRTYNQEYSTEQDSLSDLMEESIKSFPDKQNLREISTTKPVLQLILKEVL